MKKVLSFRIGFLRQNTTLIKRGTDKTLIHGTTVFDITV